MQRSYRDSGLLGMNDCRDKEMIQQDDTASVWSWLCKQTRRVVIIVDPAHYSYLCPKLKLINKKKRREERKKGERGRVLTHKGII